MIDEPIARLRITNVQKQFGPVRALKGVSLEVLPGEVHAVVGENGAGKSTLMAIAAGELTPDVGSISIDGVEVDASYNPVAARERGVVLVHQAPALVPDLTVAENLRLAENRAQRRPWGQRASWVAQLSDPWKADQLRASRFVRDISTSSQSILEIIKATDRAPKILILDEPTEHLAKDSVAKLFATIREFAALGTGIVYISHRLGEVTQIADRLTVLRDGESRGPLAAGGYTESDIVTMIAGRQPDSIFPPKSTLGSQDGPSSHPLLEVRNLRGAGFGPVDIRVAAGETVGLAGIEGHGQSEIIRAIAGLTPSDGEIFVDQVAVRLGSPRDRVRKGVGYIPRDRHGEGILGSLSIRENITAVNPRLDISLFGFISDARESRVARGLISRFHVKAPSPEATADSLSGGNQQKLVVGRVRQSNPRVILAEEPTQGVDVGSRMQVYESLRAHADLGGATLLAASDVRELTGLCDRVVVVSRGMVVTELDGDRVDEHTVLDEILRASGTRSEVRAESDARRRLRRLARSDFAPATVLFAVLLALMAVGGTLFPRFTGPLNISGILTLFAILAFASIAQQLVMLMGGIDLSIGPLMGALVVTASFVVPDGVSGGSLAGGLVTLVCLALLVAVLNWAMIAVGGINSVIATLVTFTALQGFSLLLRPQPGGSVDADLVEWLSASIGPVPIVAVVAIVVAVGLELALWRTRGGNMLRAAGSSVQASRRLGIPIHLVTLSAYAGSSVFAAVAGLLLMAQVQTGVPTVGTDYTLMSITAAALGGASVFGGRGSFIGVAMGSLVVQVIVALCAFGHLSAGAQQAVVGALTLVAVGLIATMRRPSDHLTTAIRLFKRPFLGTGRPRTHAAATT